MGPGPAGAARGLSARPKDPDAAQVLIRSDSAGATYGFAAACRAAGVGFSLGAVIDASIHELTPLLTTTMTTFELPNTVNYATVELASFLVTLSARAYGSEGWGFESLRARHNS